MSCINKEFFVKKILNYIAKRTQSIKIRDMSNAIVSFSKYVILKNFISDIIELNQRFAINKIRR